jgi:hypothetical protein
MSSTQPHRATSKRASRIDWAALRHGVVSRVTPSTAGTETKPSPILPQHRGSVRSRAPATSSSSASPRRWPPLLVLGPFAAVILLTLAIGLAVAFTLRVRPPSSTSGLPLPNSSAVGPYTGELTYYDPGLGACGWKNSSTERVCAVSHLVFDAVGTGTDPNQNILCGKKVRITREGKKNGTVEAVVVDRCEGCQGRDLDLSPALFGELAEKDEGRVEGKWDWL